MTILDTFYLLFKSNADDIQKGAKKAQKATEDLEDAAKKSGKEVEKLGENFVKLVERGTEALTAYASYSFLKNGVVDAAKFNSALEVQSKLWGQNAQQMKTYAAAAESAGGTQQGFLGNIQGLFSTLAAQGLQLPDVRSVMNHIRSTVGQYSTPAGKELAFQRLGITDQGLKSLLMQPESEYQKNLSAALENTKNDEDSYKIAREFERKKADAEQAFNNAMTTLGNTTLPTVIKAFDQLTGVLRFLSDHPYADAAAAGLGVAATSLIGGKVTGSIFSRIGLGGLSSLATGLGRAGGVIGLAGTIGAGAWWGLGKEQEFINRHFGPGSAINNWWNGGNAAGPTRRQLGFDKNESYQDFIRLGAKSGQAAAWAANEMGESGNGKLVGDGGRSIGAFQWSPQRRANILKSFGIDVTTASRSEQRRAALLEAQQMGLDVPNDPRLGAAYLVNRFEMPANPTLDAMKRAVYAAGIAKDHMNAIPALPVSGGGSGGGVSVKIGDISINTQATDAASIARDVGNALRTQIRNAVSNFDDGVQK